MTAAQSRALNELLPRYQLSFDELGALVAVLERDMPVILEIGIGNGENLVAMAAASPEYLLLGCEVHRPGLGHALQLADAAGVHNLRLLNADAIDVFAHLPALALDAVCMFFPDPWPKKRHHKRRLLDQEMLHVIHSRVKAGGRFYFASDDGHYAQQVRDLIEHSSQWTNLAGPACWAPRPRWRLMTRFERRAQLAARAVYELAATPLNPTIE